MRLEIKSLRIWSVVKVAFVVNLVVGFVLGLLMAMFFLPFIALMSSIDPSAASDLEGSAALGGAFMLIILPIGYALGNAVFGTIMVFFAALFYNMAARMFGGFEYEAEILDAQDLLDMIRSNTAAASPSYGVPPTGYYQPPQQQPQYQPAPPPRPTPPPPPPEQPHTPPPPPTDNRPPDNDPERPEGL